MAGSSSPQHKEIELILIGVGALVFFAVTLFVAVWAVRPEVIAKFYTIIREIQTFGQWEYLPGGAAFTSVEDGKQSIWMLLRSSVPFGVISAVMILTVGLIAYAKVSDEHMDNFITHRSPPDHRTIMKKFALLRPAVRFILDYENHYLSSMKGAGRLPSNPLDFLIDNKLVLRIGSEKEWADENINKDYPAPHPYKYLEIDADGIRKIMASTFGPKNPFLPLHSLSDLTAIRAAVDALPWHVVVVLAPAIARIHRSIFYNEKAYVDSVMDLHGFPDRVWRDLNKIKAKEGERLRLGFDDKKHRESENSLYLHSRGKKKKSSPLAFGPFRKPEPAPEAEISGQEGKNGLITLAEYLATSEPAKDGQGDRVKGDSLPSVIEARDLLFEALTAHLCDLRKAYPVGEDAKTKRFIFSKTEPVAPVERTYYAKVQERMIEASERLHTILQANAYVFGLLGTAVEKTREMGIYHPPPWRWMRFIDLPLWRFFLDIGKPMPTVDAMGMWEHYKTEGQLKTPIPEPFLRRCPNDLARQAARFVTPEVVAFFHKSMSIDSVTSGLSEQLLERKGDARATPKASVIDDIMDAASMDRGMGGLRGADIEDAEFVTDPAPTANEGDFPASGEIRVKRPTRRRIEPGGKR